MITDLEKSTQPWAVLTGDTLFIGDVGRPDLSKTHTPQQLAGLLYDSLHNKLIKLPDATLVYPAHGAGSLCGKNMRTERSSTIGTERLTNYALQIANRDEFVRQLTANLPARPEYFLQDAEINRTGAPALSALPPLPAISAQDLRHVWSRKKSRWMFAPMTNSRWPMFRAPSISLYRGNLRHGQEHCSGLHACRC